jgi:hypothetical protein
MNVRAIYGRRFDLNDAFATRRTLGGPLHDAQTVHPTVW